MATLTQSAPSTQNNTRNPFLQSEGLENLEQNQQTREQTEEQRKDTNSTWNTFLSADTGPQISFTRMDAPATPVNEQPAKLTFEEIFAKFQSEAPKEPIPETPFREVQNTTIYEQIEVQSTPKLEGTISFGSFEQTISEPKIEPQSTKTEDKKSTKDHLKSSAESALNVSSKVAKSGFKESKDIFNACKDLWSNFVFFREKKPDPKAKENAEKAAKRKANKQRFISLLREGMSIYHAEMRKAVIELEVKLGVNVLRTEDRNRFLGRNRNLSYEGNDSIYAIHQTAYEMVEQKKRQQQAQAPKAAPRGKPSRGQIFTDKNLSGERSAGNNMMSAVG